MGNPHKDYIEYSGGFSLTSRILFQGNPPLLLGCLKDWTISGEVPLLVGVRAGGGGEGRGEGALPRRRRQHRPGCRWRRRSLGIRQAQAVLHYQASCALAFGPPTCSSLADLFSRLVAMCLRPAAMFFRLAATGCRLAAAWSRPAATCFMPGHVL